MATGRLYQAALTVDVDIPEPSGRIYQAYTHTVDPPAPPTARIYQAHMSAAAGGVGVGRIYQAKVTAALPEAVVPSGIRTFRGSGTLVPLTARVYRAGAL
ncbi:MAG TPA: hypothetical protein VKY91_16675 [Vulgatibacteraceae bacterium]|nr:hypothetical protein [Vulgatibacteraceae bacterium]